MPRGGRRPGLGAPKGNWNALTSGRRSKRLRALVLTLRDDPHFMVVYRLLIAAATRQQRRAKADQSLLDVARAITNETSHEDPLILSQSKDDDVSASPEPVARMKVSHQQE